MPQATSKHIDRRAAIKGAATIIAAAAGAAAIASAQAAEPDPIMHRIAELRRLWAEATAASDRVDAVKHTPACDVASDEAETLWEEWGELRTAISKAVPGTVAGAMAQLAIAIEGLTDTDGAGDLALLAANRESLNDDDLAALNAFTALRRLLPAVGAST